MGFTPCWPGPARRCRGGKLLVGGCPWAGLRHSGHGRGTERGSRLWSSHPGGAAPGEDWGAAVAQPLLLGHRLMTARQPPPESHSCLEQGAADEPKRSWILVWGTKSHLSPAVVGSRWCSSSARFFSSGSCSGSCPPEVAASGEAPEKAGAFYTSWRPPSSPFPPSLLPFPSTALPSRRDQTKRPQTSLSHSSKPSLPLRSQQLLDGSFWGWRILPFANKIKQNFPDSPAPPLFWPSF